VGEELPFIVSWIIYSGSQLGESIMDVKSPVILGKNASFDFHSIANSYKCRNDDIVLKAR
jgi:hypothetical protein